jgi:hypothetical protein
MDAVTLLRRAKDAGLRVEQLGDKLVVRGPKRAEKFVKLLAKHKLEVLAALSDTELLAPSPWFERAIPTTGGEPGLEQPCVARRGRVQKLERGFLHFCIECGRFGAFGFGVSIRSGRLGHWFCEEHRPPFDGATRD